MDFRNICTANSPSRSITASILEIHTSSEKECAFAHSRAERGRLRHVSASRECASLARQCLFGVIGNSKEFPITPKKRRSFHFTDASLFYLIIHSSKSNLPHNPEFQPHHKKTSESLHNSCLRAPSPVRRSGSCRLRDRSRRPRW